MKPGGHLVDEEVALRIIDFVLIGGRSRLQTEITRAHVAPTQIEPTLLSVILQELNNRRLQNGQEKITAESSGSASHEISTIFICVAWREWMGRSANSSVLPAHLVRRAEPIGRKRTR